jgi:DNA-binding CsgD family transcriptional regulator
MAGSFAKDGGRMKKTAYRASWTTAREKAVLACLLDGIGVNKVIAHKIGAGEETIRRDLKALEGRYGVKGKLSLVLAAARHA